MTNKDRKVLTRLKKEQDPAQIDKNIEQSLKINRLDLMDPFDAATKNSLFFRINVSGRIESAKVTFTFFL